MTWTVPRHVQSTEARWLTENYANEARSGAPYAGQWVVVQGEGIVFGASSPQEIADYVRANYPSPGEVLVARLISDPLG